MDNSKTSYTEDIRLAPSQELVCYCSEISKGEILLAISQGADTLQAIKAKTGACAIAKCKELNPRGR